MALKDMYYTISEAARELGVSRQTIYRWIADGKVPTEKIGGVMLVEKAAISRIRTIVFGFIVRSPF